jgi:hypothetical protein
MPETTPRAGRETRLLALVILVAIAALLVLARFRFPEAAERVPVAPPPGPLERLAARAPFQDLAATLNTLTERLAPSLLVVQISEAPAAGAGAKSATSTAADKGRRRSPTPEVVAETPALYVPAIRVAKDRALFYLPPGARVLAIGGIVELKPAVSTSPQHPLALVTVSSSDDSPLLLGSTVDGFSGFAYTALVEGARGGFSPRPFYIGRVDEIPDATWPAPLLAVGSSVDIPPGSFLVTLDGRLVGMALRTPHGPTILPARALNTVVAALLAAGGGG